MAYKNVHDTFWNDPLVKTLESEVRYLYLYFITGRHSHYSGLYYLPMIYIKEDTALTDNEIKKGIAILQAKDRILYDEKTEMVFVKKMLKHQIKNAKPNVKQMGGIISHFKSLHNTKLILEFFNYWNHLRSLFTDNDISIRIDNMISEIQENPATSDNPGIGGSSLNPSPKNKKEYSKECIKLSKLLAQLILENNPDYFHLQENKYQSTLNGFMSDIDKLIRVDNAKPEKIDEVIRWCQADDFWKDNILSGIKLRKQYPQLLIKSKKGNGKEEIIPPYHVSEK